MKLLVIVIVGLLVGFTEIFDLIRCDKLKIDWIGLDWIIYCVSLGIELFLVWDRICRFLVMSLWLNEVISGSQNQ